MTISTSDAQALAKSDWQSLSPVAKCRLRWRLEARPNQLTPDGDWFAWLLLGGRGSGKTRPGAEDHVKYAYDHPGSRQAIVVPTFGDGRDTCVEGESGIRAIMAPSEWAETTWNRSMGELIFPNGSQSKIFSAEEPERLRGPQHHRVWCDELAAWKYLQETWDMLMFGLRLGERAQAVITTTPKPRPVVRELLKRDDVVIARMSTYDNLANLAPTYAQQILTRYEGTRLGRQELYGELLEDVEGALWTAAMIEESRRNEHPDLVRVVVAVDPAVTAKDDSDETGIIVAGIGVDGRGYVLADRSCRLSPDGAMRRAVQAYHEYQADRVVVEANNGGDYLPAVLHAVDPNVAVGTVHASRGKTLRAEPVSALYEQGRVSHVGTHQDLEDQMTSWVQGDPSPDRLDALVWALTELMPLQGVPVFLGAA